MRHQLAVLLVIGIAWHASIEALPIEAEGSDAVLLQDAKAAAKETPEQAAAKAKAAHSTAVVKEMRRKAACNGDKACEAHSRNSQSTGGTAATGSTTTTSAISTGSTPHRSTSTAKPTVPEIKGVKGADAVSTIAKAKTAKEHPTGPKHVGKLPLKTGDDGWIAENAKKHIFTAETDAFKLSARMAEKRKMEYDQAKAADKVADATKEASNAAAAMVNQVRSEEASKVANQVKKIAGFQAKIANAQKKKGKKAQDLVAKLQIKLAKAKQKKTKLMAKAAKVGNAANKILMKAGIAEGRAMGEAAIDDDKDGSSKTQVAVIAAAKAKLALSAFDANVKQSEQEKADDKKVKKHFKGVQKKIIKEKVKAKEDYEKAVTKASSENTKEAIDAANDYARKAHLLNNAKPIKADKKKKLSSSVSPSSSPSPAPATSTADSVESAQAAANAAVARAHKEQTPQASKAAEKAIEHLRKMKDSAKPK